MGLNAVLFEPMIAYNVWVHV